MELYINEYRDGQPVRTVLTVASAEEAKGILTALASAGEYHAETQPVACTVFCVYHEWDEDIEEYGTHHTDLHLIFATEALAAAYVASKEYRESDHYTHAMGRTVLTELPTAHVMTEPEFRKL